MKLNIGHVCMHYPPAIGYGGMPVSTIGIARGLARLGHNIKVLSSDVLSYNKDKLREEIFNECDANIAVYRFKHFLSRRGAIQLSLKPWLNKLQDCDLLIIHGIYGPFLRAAIYALKTRKPYLVYPHGQLMKKGLQSKAWKKYFYFKLIVKPLVNRAASLVVTSQDELNQCRDLGISSKIAIIPHGVDFDLFQKLPDREIAFTRWPTLRNKKVILFLSRISEEKGLYFLLDAWSQIYLKYPQTVLVMAGDIDTPYARTLASKIKQMNIADRTFLYGGVYDKDKINLFSVADVFVLPSISENFGLVVLEALAAGIPVVTTQGTPWRQLESNKIGKWVPVNPIAIQSALEYYLELSPIAKYNCSLRAIQFVRDNFTWDKTANSLDKFITDYIDIKKVK